MNGPKCSRLWLIEAIRDGRVIGDERASFERHQTSCVACTQASQAAHSAREKLSELPAGLPDTFTLRRQRRGLLQAFNASLVSAPIIGASHHGRLFLSVVAFAVSAALGVWLFWRPTGASSWVHVVAGSGASWSEQKTSGIDRVTLHSGRFQLSIRRPSPKSRVLIALPDGEIEDLGTVLEVWTDGARTRHVAVKSGAVVLRLRDAPERRLRTGESWDRANALEPTQQPLSPSQSERASLPVEDQLDSSDLSAAPPKQLATPVRAASAHHGARPAPSERKIQVAGAVEVEQRPSKAAPTADGAGAEDAAYLLLLNEFEAGRRADARVAAKAYLAKYPHGFRHLEVLRIETELEKAP